MKRRPHRLELYRRAVQHPEAESQFLFRCHEHYFGVPPTRLREDFAGTAAVAAAFVALDENHRALAVEKHGPTARWAQRRARRDLGERAEDLHVVQGDVLELAAPKVDVVCALNFSAFIYHGRESLTAYLRHARRCLGRSGILVLDAFGGPGSMRTGTQQRRVRPPAASGIEPVTYEWEQRSFDHTTHRIDCRIHFQWTPEARLDNAFRYDWRLWTLPELTELIRAAGFRRADVWCDQYDPETGTSDGIYRPTTTVPAREDFVAYLVGMKAG